jgi:hypothetical protein
MTAAGAGYVYAEIPAPGPWQRTPLWIFWRRLRGQTWRRKEWDWATDVPLLLEPEWRYIRDVDFLLMD